MTSGVVLLRRVEEYKKRQARALRKNLTKAERTLWEYLRNGRLCGLKFRRQQVIEGFIVDFFCHKLKLVIEVDGDIHNTPEQCDIDEHRGNVFELRGLKEIRFKNDDVLNNMSYVLNTIKNYETK